MGNRGDNEDGTIDLSTSGLVLTKLSLVVLV